MAGSAQSSNPVSDALRASLKSAAGKMVAAAKEMPADKYSFKPTPESRTFGALVLHIANSNTGTCKTLGGAAPAPKNTLTATSSKDDLVKALQASYDYCAQALTNLNDSGLGQEVPFFGGRKITKAAMVLALSDDWADHYSQEAAYLRLNGHLPPTARPRGGGMRGMGGMGH